jgi:hypothetical protein
MELGLSWEAIMQLTAGKEEAEEKAEQITEDLQCECLPLYFYLCSIGCMLSIWLLFCRVSAPSTCTTQGLWRPGESTGYIVEAMTTGIKPVLDCIGFEPSEGREQLHGDLPPRSIID